MEVGREPSGLAWQDNVEDPTPYGWRVTTIAGFRP